MVDTLAEARMLEDDVVDLRRAIHAEPELGNDLPATTAKVEAALADLPLTIRHSRDTTSLVATLEGGEPGAVGELTLTRANGERAALPSKVAGLSLAPGDRVRLATSGGGGYGSPEARSPLAHQADVSNGYVREDAD